MRRYIIALKALVFDDERGNFIVREEYASMGFSCMEWANKFMSERKKYYEDLFGIKLNVSPDHHESMDEEHIIPVFDLVGEYLGFEKGKIYEKTQKWKTVHARWYAMKICADRGLTESQIGKAIGMNPATVNNGKTGLSALMLKNEAIRADFNLATDYALYAISGKYAEDGSGKQLIKPTYMKA